MTNDLGQPVTAPRTHGLAVAALACGVAGLVVFPVACLAIALGHIARHEIRRTGQAGRGMATAGLILGYAPLVAGILFFVYMYSMIYLAAHAPQPAWIPASRATAGGR